MLPDVTPARLNSLFKDDTRGVLRMIDENDIKSVFGAQLDAIADEDLKGKVVNAWVNGCKRGNWNTLDEIMKRGENPER